MARKPVVAIVGRPNVGKSTFVNRLVGKRESIVDDMPGVTRDRIYFDVEWQGKPFTVIDTGGIIPGDEDEIMLSIFTQAEIACEEADKIIFLVDGIDGITPIDRDIANQLRRSKKEILLVVNKIDTPEKRVAITEFYELSLGEPIAVSAMHGSGGVGDLLDIITKDFQRVNEEDEEKKIRIAIVGKPNAGKSSIVNKVLGEDRVIVSDVAGTTRDVIDSKVKVDGREFILVDTAGIRKKAKVGYGIERFAVARALNAIKEADIAVIVIDATEGLTDQDKKIAQVTIESGRGVILAINKWDLVENKESNTINKFTNTIRFDAPFLDFAPMLFISAKTGQRVRHIFEKAVEVYEQCNKKVSTSLLNRVIQEAFALNPPTSKKGKKLRSYYTTQLGVAPPTFIIFINDLKLVQDSYKRYLENKMRDAFGFFGTPIRLIMRERKEKG